MIPKSCNQILDVGCGTGERWKNFSGEVTGIEVNEEAARVASGVLKNVVVGDLENLDLRLKAASFDCIVFADVLEHLYDPWGTLEKMKKYLRTEGVVLVSIPNIRHYRVLRALLLKGEFKYKDSGILDKDHLRFFTRKQIMDLVSGAGLEIMSVKRALAASSKHKILNTLFLGALSDFLTQQYYVLAKVKT